MGNERGPHVHQWGCAPKDTRQPELLQITPLAAADVSAITNDPRQIDRVCPGGVVRCTGCPAHFSEEQKQQDQKDTAGRLQRIRTTLQRHRVTFPRRRKNT